MPLLTPADAAQAQDMIAAAAAEHRPMEIRAGASKCALGRTERPQDVLDVSQLVGVIDYDPSELILTVRAATPMAEIGVLLSQHRQMLSFEPPDWSALLGARETTLGGERRDRGAFGRVRRETTFWVSRRSMAGASPGRPAARS